MLYDNKDEIISHLFSLLRSGIKPGLERTLKLLEFAGNPHLRFKSIHIAGTNGKGSVCSTIASIMMESGFRIGLYTSPHIIQFNERIRINGLEISDNEIVALARRILPKATVLGCTFFEVTTVLAFIYFAENNIDYAVIETGLGGRFDSTNVINPLVSIITKVDYDHQEYLGNSIEQIAYEKAGIIKKGIPIVLSYSNRDLHSIFLNQATDKSSKLIVAKEYIRRDTAIFEQDFSMSFSLYDLEEEIINSPISGTKQIENIDTALTAISTLQDFVDIPQQAIIAGLKNISANTGLRGRMQFLKNCNQKILVDVAHNPSAIHCLIENVKLHSDEKWNFIFAVMNDKDYTQIFDKVLGIANKIYLPKLEIERALSPEVLDKIAKSKNYSECYLFENTSRALDCAIQDGNPLIITGSFYLLEEALESQKISLDF